MPKMTIGSYVHFFPPAKPDPNFPSQYVFRLIDTIDDLRSYLSQPTKHMAFDLETTGLSAERDTIVGVALCQDAREAAYIPINHHNGGLGKEALDMIYDTLCLKERVFVFNLRFDFRMMEWYSFKEFGYQDAQRSFTVGYDMSKVKYLDVAIPCYLADTNMGAKYGSNEVNFVQWKKESGGQLKVMSLKHWSLHFLGWTQTKFNDVLGDSASLYYVDYHDVVYYAATDALATFNLAYRLTNIIKETGFATQLDNNFLYPLMRCEQNTVLLDEDHLNKLEEEVEPEIDAVRNELANVIVQINPSLALPRTSPKTKESDLDFVLNFNLNSSPQRVSLFTYMGVDTGVYSEKTGVMKTGKPEMQNIIETYPPNHLASRFATLFLEYSKLTKLNSSYIVPLRREIELHDGRTRFSYRVDRAPTTRLAGGAESKKRAKDDVPFFSMMNIQAIVKPKSCRWYTRPVVGSPTTDTNFLGWEFSINPFPLERPQWTVEGMSPKLNLRKVLRADEGYTIVSCDFQAQELRIPTGLSKEPVWTQAFLSGEDVHETTARKIWPDSYTRDKRKYAKAAEFALLYGGNEYTVKRNIGISDAEAKKLVDDLKTALPTLFTYMDNVIKKARTEHVVYTHFGHPRRLRYFYKSNDFRMRAFADRTALNSPIQGCGADIMKIAFLKVWQGLYNDPVYKGKCNFMSTIHDSLDSQVKTELLSDFMKRKVDLMSLNIPGWEIPMEVGASVGNSWGEIFDFEWVDGKWIPKFESPNPWVPQENTKTEEDVVQFTDDLFSDFDEDEEFD